LPSAILTTRYKTKYNNILYLAPSSSGHCKKRNHKRTAASGAVNASSNLAGANTIQFFDYQKVLITEKRKSDIMEFFGALKMDKKEVRKLKSRLEKERKTMFVR
jgi:hypothetical protein